MSFMGVTDFNLLETTGFIRGQSNAYGEIGVRPIDGAFAAAYFPAMRNQISRALSNAYFLAPRPIPVHGLCPTDLPGKSARYQQ